MGALYERKKFNGVTRTTNKKTGAVSWSKSTYAGNGKTKSTTVSSKLKRPKTVIRQTRKP